MICFLLKGSTLLSQFVGEDSQAINVRWEAVSALALHSFDHFRGLVVKRACSFVAARASLGEQESLAQVA